MRKATAIYRAPEGDNKVCEMGGVTFFDGHEIELNSDDHGHMIEKLQNNQHFEIQVGDDDGKDAPAPQERDFKAGIEAARDHDFEADRRAGPKKRGRPSNAEKAAREHEGEDA